MSTQLLIYKDVAPLSKERHAKWSVEVGRDFAHTKNLNVLPVLAAEFVSASREYPIVFSKTEENITPVLLLGMRSEENLYLTADNQWSASYIPAFLRRYPFVFARSDDGKTFTLCLDEKYEGFNQKDQGRRLFSDDGEPTDYVKSVMTFLQSFQTEQARSQAFCRKLDEFDLFESHNATWTGPEGQKVAITGFSCISRKKLNELSPKVLASLLNSGEMDLIFAHLFSIMNFNQLKDKLAVTA